MEVARCSSRSYERSENISDQHRATILAISVSWLDLATFSRRHSEKPRTGHASCFHMCVV